MRAGTPLASWFWPCLMPLAAGLAAAVVVLTELAASVPFNPRLEREGTGFLAYASPASMHGFYGVILVFALAHLIGIGIHYRNWLRLLVATPTFIALNLLPLYGGVPMLVVLVAIFTYFILMMMVGILVYFPEPGMLLALGAAGTSFGLGMRLAAVAIAGRRWPEGIPPLWLYVAAGLSFAAGLIATDSVRNGLSTATEPWDVQPMLRHALFVCLLMFLPVGIAAVRAANGRMPRARELALVTITGILLMLFAFEVAHYLIVHKLSLSAKWPALEPFLHHVRAQR